MVFRSQKTFNKVYLDREHPSDFINFVAESTRRALINKLMNELDDHKIHIVELKTQEFRENFPTTRECALKQDLVCEKLVQCKNCMMVYPWCQKFRDEFDGYGFCPYGRGIEEEAKDEIF